MTRTSAVVLLAISLVSGCTSDPMGLRSPYRDRIVPPSANTQPISNPPIAVQPGGQLGQPVGISRTVILPQSAISNMAAASNMAAQGTRNGWNSPYPMFASAGGNIDGRPFGLLTRAVRIPGAGGARHRRSAVRNTALAGGVVGSPQEDLKYRGGHTIKDLKYMNIFVGGSAAWKDGDWKSIDKNLDLAMSDQNLNNVIIQYFNNQPVSSQFLGSFFLNGWNPKLVAKNDLAAQIQGIYRSPKNPFNGLDLPNTVFNFILPRGVVLGDPSGGQQQRVSNPAIPLADAEDSTGGLGGYHGSVHIDGKTIYYAVGVYSERLPNGGTNGIPVFDQNWKNVVATFYHELQEARTDADVDDATNGMSVLGWTSDSGNEIGDYPIAEAKQLTQVFQEVPLTDGSGTVPVQLCYSNGAHGPEGPIPYPYGMGPGSNRPQPQNNQPANDPPSNKPSSPVSGLPSNLPPEIVGLITNWDQTQDYIKLAIKKLLQ